MHSSTMTRPRDFIKDGVKYIAMPGRDPNNCAGCDLFRKAKDGVWDCVQYKCGPFIFKAVPPDA